MTLRADDGTILEVKVPIILDPEGPRTSSFEPHRDYIQAEESEQRPGPKFSPWLIPLVLLGVIAFLVFGTFFATLFLGIALLVGLVKLLGRVFDI